MAEFFAFAYSGPYHAAIVDTVPVAMRSMAFAFEIFIIHALGDAVSPFLLGVISDGSSLGSAIVVAMKCGLWFLGGVALGVLGAVAVSKGKLDFKPLATDLLSRGMDVKDALLSKVEAIKEDVEDLTAEARLAAEKRKTTKDASEA